jgi:uncharacterized protein DUF6894
MNRYFFDLRDEDGVVADEQGILLSSLEAVQDEAARAIGDLARDEMRRIKADASETRMFAVEVRDDTGAVMHAKFSCEIKRLL